MLDRRRVETLFLERERALYNVAYRWTWNEAEARELVQEAFLRLWAARRRVEEEGANAYLFRVLLNLGQRHARRRSILDRVRQLLPGSTDAGADEPAAATDREHVREAIAALGPHHRDVLLLTEYSGLKQREIAELLRIPPGTVASRRSQALAKLKEALGDG